MGEKTNMAKSIGASVVGSSGGNKVADKLHLGGMGHMAGGIGGSMLANNAMGKFEHRNDGK